MELLHPRCAGIDISKRDAKVCVRIAGSGRRRAAETVTTWSSMTNQVLALRDHLIQERVTCVVLEATSDYWKPFVRHEAPRNRVGMKGPCRWSVAAGR
jgi:transposase